jgi:hypothetical protein
VWAVFPSRNLAVEHALHLPFLPQMRMRSVMTRLWGAL